MSRDHGVSRLNAVGAWKQNAKDAAMRLLCSDWILVDVGQLRPDTEGQVGRLISRNRTVTDSFGARPQRPARATRALDFSAAASFVDHTVGTQE